MAPAPRGKRTVKEALADEAFPEELYSFGGYHTGVLLVISWAISVEFPEQAKLDNLADDPNSTYATKTDIQIIEDNPDYLVFPVDFRKTRKEMKAVCKEYYDSICAREISVDRPIYFKFFWYDDPANPETSTFSTLITPCSENPEINSDNPFSILRAVANLPVRIITPEEIEDDPDFVGRGRTVEQVDGIDYFIEEILDIPTFTGIASQYSYKLTATPCKPQIYTVSEYSTDVNNYPDGTIFIKHAL